MCVGAGLSIWRLRLDSQVCQDDSLSINCMIWLDKSRIFRLKLKTHPSRKLAFQLEVEP
jgi:hypothetical protein